MSIRSRDHVPLQEHLEIIRLLEGKLAEERDRRYAEVNIEREKALKIKEEADRTALQLARENQNLKDENQKQVQLYKDEKANELRSQIERERGNYTTRTELSGVVERFESILKPMTDYVSAQTGRSEGLSAGWGFLVGAIGIGISVALAISKFAG